MQGRFLYFAYGSNMLTHRLVERCPGAEAIGVGRLPGHRLEWHKRGRDGSGKCDAHETGLPGDTLHGVLYSIPETEQDALDSAEGNGRGYLRAAVTVFRTDGSAAGTRTYRALELDAALAPYDWYRAYVLAGAREHGLPEADIAAIASVRTRRDPNPVRRAREAARIRRFGLADGMLAPIKGD